MTLTPFGVAVRKARLDLNMSLKDMAQAVHVSSSFLSAIESGRKPLNDALYVQIEKLFKDKKRPVATLRVLADLSNQKVSLKGLSQEKARLVSSLAHTKLTGEVVAQIKALLTDPPALPSELLDKPAEDAKNRAFVLSV